MISRKKNVISFRITRSLPNTSLHYDPNNLNHPKETLTPHKKLQTPPPNIYTPLEQSARNFGDNKHLKKIQPPPKKSVLSLHMTSHCKDSQN